MALRLNHSLLLSRTTRTGLFLYRGNPVFFMAATIVESIGTVPDTLEKESGVKLEKAATFEVL